MYNLPQVDSKVTVWFSLDGQEYEVSQFDISFFQGVDGKGEPQDHVRGGQMTMTLNQTLPESLYNWAMQSSTKEGKIDFRIESGSSPMKIEFSNAYCLNFNRSINSIGGGVSTSLTISPEEIIINGRSFDNHWVKY
ncbi:type VI secretion system tube protein TssD [Marinilabilia salmonicolor]|uniref:type VI secretion system tube protein TssD n=1 Tax=Marinilabilia salmonicolor TaxID=989 RepID=UPI00029A6516|nr:type VI secretion system tube protein TssD [Marinilabilia salmonicolor]